MRRDTLNEPPTDIEAGGPPHNRRRTTFAGDAAETWIPERLVASNEGRETAREVRRKIRTVRNYFKEETYAWVSLE